MLEYKMKDLTLCIACVILGILLAMMFKQACGCKQVVEGFDPNSIEDVVECVKNDTDHPNLGAKDTIMNVYRDRKQYDPQLVEQIILGGTPPISEVLGCQ